MIESMCASWRAEASAAAARLAAIGRLFELRLVEFGETPDWTMDTWAAVVDEVAAALRTSRGMASSYLRYARAMRDRLPQVGAVFAAGAISYEVFQTIVFRTDLIADEQILARVDAELAVRAARWPSMTRGRLSLAIDAVVTEADPDARRRVREQVRDRKVVISEGHPGSGIGEVIANLFSADAAALDQRLDALAGTVCEKDPRSRDQRRADALGALAAGADRLLCRCARPDCPAAGKAPAGRPIIHMVAERATVEGRSDTPGLLLGGDGWLVPAEVIAELAATAKCQPVVHPADAAAETHYRPSAALAAFVRARDLTCRAPGCDHPAWDCDIDHVVAWANGGPTHASNLHCLCRKHHLLKTFWGWLAKQLPDGTVIWTLPAGQIYVTHPGSALLFPSLCAPTADLPPPPEPDRDDRCGSRAAMMPLRNTTRAENRARYIATERRRNHQARAALVLPPADGSPPPDPDDEVPPF